MKNPARFVQTLLLTAVPGLVLALVSACAGLSVPADSPSPTPPSRVRILDNTVVSADGQLLRGAHIQLVPATRPLDVSRKVMRRLRAAGANLVRITHDGDGQGSLRPARSLESLLPLLDLAVENGGKEGLVVKVEYARNAPGCRPDREDLSRFWQTVAPRYAACTWVIYGIANEPAAWLPEDYTAADRDLQAETFRLIRKAAPDTHIMLWGFSSLKEGPKPEFLQVPGVDWSNESVDFHGYGVISERLPAWREWKKQVPLFCGEFTRAPESEQLLSPLEEARILEQEGISWCSLAMDGLKAFR